MSNKVFLRKLVHGGNSFCDATLFWSRGEKEAGGLKRAVDFFRDMLWTAIEKGADMDNNVFAKTPEQVIEAIFALDLEPIKMKLQDPEEGQGWSVSETEYYEREYKRFLALRVKYPHITIAPDREVDAFWHAHILDTMKYAEDCQNVFGYFLHHYPYFGLGGEEDAAALSDAFANMQHLYDLEFNNGDSTTFVSAVSGTGVPGTGKSGKPAWCRAEDANSAGKPAWCRAEIVKQEARPAWCR